MRLLTASVWRNLLALVGMQAGNYIAPLLLLPLLAQRLQPAGYGDYAFILAATVYTVLLVDWGFSLSATKAVSVARGDAAEIAKIFWSTVAAKLLLGVVAITVATILVCLLPALKSIQNALLCSIVLSVIGTIVAPTFYFQGIESMGVMALVNAVVRIAAIPVTWFFVVTPQDIMLAVIIQASTIALAGGVNFMQACRRVPLISAKLDFSDVKNCLNSGRDIFFSMAAVSAYTSTNIVVLKFIATPQVVGYFYSAQAIVKAACGLYAPISQAIFPRVSQLFSVDPSKAAIMLGGFIRWQILLTSMLSLLLFITAPWVIHLFFGSEYEPSVLPLQIMSVLPLILALSNTLGVQVLLPLGDERAFSRILMSCGSISLLLTPLMGIFANQSGVAIALVITELLVVIGMSMQLYRNHRSVFQSAIARV